MKNIFAIIGSASKNSSNEKLVALIARQCSDTFKFTIFTDLKSLPHFDADETSDNPPNAITNFRANIERADGILICTPEYVLAFPAD